MDVGQMERPKILSTSKTDESFAGYKYHLEGELVPALTVELMPGQSVYFEHHRDQHEAHERCHETHDGGNSNIRHAGYRPWAGLL